MEEVQGRQGAGQGCGRFFGKVHHLPTATSSSPKLETGLGRLATPFGFAEAELHNCLAKLRKDGHLNDDESFEALQQFLDGASALPAHRF